MSRLVKIKKSREGVVAHERLTEPRVSMVWLLAKPRSFSNLPAFLDLYDTWKNVNWKSENEEKP